MPVSKPQQQKRIRPDEKIPLRLSQRERQLIIEKTFAPDELTLRLRLVQVEGKAPIYRFTLDELDELAGYVAAEANHAKSKKLENELDRIFNRIDDLLGRYTDEEN